MPVTIQTYVPGTAPEVLTATLHVHMDSAGQTTLGWRIHDTATDEVLCLGATPALAHEEGVAEAHALLVQLLEALPIVVEPAPFD